MKNTEPDLKRFSRKELLELLVEQGREMERLKAVCEELEAKLADRTLRMERAGTLAEASMLLNGVLDAADRAAAQYLENAKRIAEESEAEAEKLRAAVRAECDSMRRRCKEECDRMILDAQGDGDAWEAGESRESCLRRPTFLKKNGGKNDGKNGG